MATKKITVIIDGETRTTRVLCELPSLWGSYTW